jgi:hypothetical protein
MKSCTIKAVENNCSYLTLLTIYANELFINDFGSKLCIYIDKENRLINNLHMVQGESKFKLNNTSALCNLK